MVCYPFLVLTVVLKIVVVENNISQQVTYSPVSIQKKKEAEVCFSSVTKYTVY